MIETVTNQDAFTEVKTFNFVPISHILALYFCVSCVRASSAYSQHHAFFMS